jgi:hypothetical protein
MPPNTPTVSEVVENVLNEGTGPIIKAGMRGEISRETLDAAQDFKGIYQDALATGRQLEADLADLHGKKDLLPAAGFERLARDARAEADTKVRALDGDGRRAYERMKSGLEADTLPRFDPSREQLARDEAALALSGPGDPSSLARDLALNGTEESVAALLSPWGATLLRARGVERPDAVLKSVRDVAVQRAIGEGRTTAAQLLRGLGKLGAVMGSAGSETRSLVRGEGGQRR